MSPRRFAAAPSGRTPRGARLQPWSARGLAVLALVLAGMFATALPAAAQDTPLDAAARRTLRPAAARAAEAPAAAPLTRRRGPTRTDAAGRVRADYRLDTAPLAAPGTAPEGAARAFLASRAARYGLGPDVGAVLRLDTVVAGALGATVRFAQVAWLGSGEALPVVGRGVSVTMGADGRVSMATSNVASVGLAVPPFRMSADEAAGRVRTDVLAVPGDVRVVGRVAFVGAGSGGADAPVRPAYLVRATPEAPGGVPVAWEAVVDGETGALLLLTERVAGHRRGGASAVSEAAPRVGPRRDGLAWDGEGRDVRARPLREASSVPLADGTGLAFVPDPLTSAGVAYGTGGFVDGNDADTPDLSAQRREVALPGIAFSGGRYTLVGPYAEITGEAVGGGIASVVPSEASPSFRYARSDPRFESVMAYHHLDASQRYVQRLALGRPIRERPVRVSSRGTTSDDSYFAFDQNALVFGTGGIDDAEDADVIWHEYGHVLLHDQTPGLFENFEARALHEGWSDFWAASYSHRLITEGRVPDHDWRRIYSWDGNNGCWQGRRLDHSGVYSPTDRSRMGYPARPGCAAPSTLYQWGLLWATTLADIQSDIGVEVSNRIVVASLAMLGGGAGPFPAAPPMEVAAEALLAADRALYGGAHEAALVARLSARGFVDAGRFGPVVRHTPLASTEQSGGTRRVEVEAVGASSPVAAVRVVFRIDGGAAQTLALAEAAPTRYAGDLALPAGPATVAYAIEATDAAGRTTRVPASADSVFTFATGPDRTAPALAHTPRLTAPRGAFPLRLVASARDALGIDTVTVAYALERGGAAVRQGVAGLGRVAGTAATFVGTVPLAQTDVLVGDVLVYTVHARDRATALNEATAGPFRVPVVAEGVVASFGAEADEGVETGGAWRRGVPVRGLVRARAGQGVYSTGLAAPYPATRGTSVLALPPLDLSFGSATLAVSMWHDLERGGACRSACDGGQAQVSTDDGVTWRRLDLAASAPALPAPGADTLAVLPTTGALLDGPRVVGGTSMGWQRATAALPSAPSVRVRFVLATDDGNVYPTLYAYAGWALDSITVSTTPPALPAVPALAAVTVPEIVTPGDALPVSVSITTPDGALATATVLLRRAGSVVRRDSVRLAQDARDLRRFAGAVVTTGALAGDTLALTLRVRDTAGRDVVHRMAVPVRSVTTTDALASVTASGLWRLRDGLWAASDAGDTAPPPPPTSSLVFAPRAIPDGAERVRLVLCHRIVLGAGAGGMVEVSSDDGRSWAPIVPARGYPATLAAPGHPLDGAAVFAGRDTTTAVFDLSAFRGQTVRLRLRLATSGRLAFGDLWEVTSARVEVQAASSLPDAPGTFAVSRPFPNPFRDRLSIAVTLPEPSPLDAVLVDALGRRVAVLAGGEVREAGTHVLRAGAPDLAAGVYVLIVRAGRERWTGTVVAVR